MRFVLDSILIAYARRAAFKFEVYDILTFVDRTDSYVLVGSGVDTIDKALAVMAVSRRNYIIIDDPDSGVLRPTVDDLVFMRAQYVLLYGAVNNAPFNEPLGV